MVSAEALAALAALEQGATFNTTHTIARELMAASLAFEDFGRLQITEQGRVYLRRSNTHRTFIPAAEGVSDLSQHRAIDPMANPMSTPVPDLTEAQLKGLAELKVDTGLAGLTGVRARAMRAAGAASGKTGIWVEQIWVEEFINALEAEETLST